jgi:predicted transcriptional regulator
MEEVARNLLLLPAIVKTCINRDDFLGSFDVTDEESSLIIKFQFVDILPDLYPADLQNICSKFHGKSKVLLLVSEKEEKFSIYWKSTEIDEFLELKHTKKLDWESDRSLSDYIAEFLTKSLHNDHLGKFRNCLNEVEQNRSEVNPS